MNKSFLVLIDSPCDAKVYWRRIVGGLSLVLMTACTAISPQQQAEIARFKSLDLTEKQKEVVRELGGSGSPGAPFDLAFTGKIVLKDIFKNEENISGRSTYQPQPAGYIAFSHDTVFEKRKSGKVVQNGKSLCGLAPLVVVDDNSTLGGTFGGGVIYAYQRNSNLSLSLKSGEFCNPIVGVPLIYSLSEKREFARFGQIALGSQDVKTSHERMKYDCSVSLNDGDSKYTVARYSGQSLLVDCTVSNHRNDQTVRQKYIFLVDKRLHLLVESKGRVLTVMNKYELCGETEKAVPAACVKIPKTQ